MPQICNQLDWGRNYTWRPQSWQNECRSLAFKKIDCFTCSVRWTTHRLAETVKNSPQMWPVTACQAATDVTEARHDNRRHWPWLLDRRVSNKTDNYSPTATDRRHHQSLTEREKASWRDVILRCRTRCVQSAFLYVFQCNHILNTHVIGKRASFS